MERYEIAIIGTGPAGLSAAITAAIRNKKILLLGSAQVSEKMKKAHKIYNYLGIPEVSGEDLARACLSHIQQMHIEITEDKVQTVYAMGQYFAIQTVSGSYEADTVILASGVYAGKMLPGEEEYLGKGVSYCATCDAMLYRGKDIAVIGFSKEAEKEVDFLAKIVGNTHYIPLYEGKCDFAENVQMHEEKPVRIEELDGKKRLVLQNEVLDVDGIFILRDSMPPAQLIPGLSIDEGHVQVDRSMKTNIKGCFACGDITGMPYQYMKAAGEGNVAALSAVSFLQNK